MQSVVCTLFEKHYHHGVAALINSLYQNNYRGSVYAGYKGNLPAWCSSGKPNSEIPWDGASTFQIAEDFKVHFLPINTEMHFAFYKPYFMIDLFETVGEEVDGIAYFDPDIVIKCKWVAFEVWMSYGVAVVHESIYRPATHPLRGEWKKVIDTINRQITRSLDIYMNSGFCGVAKQNIEFLTLWVEVIEAGTKYFKLTPTRFGQSSDRTYLFYALDQDAFNIVAMCCNAPISEIGPEGMDLIPGGFVMSHALGRPKPWMKKFIRSALRGVPPSLADKGFWANSTGPIQAYSKSFLKVKRIKISVAAFIGRFYKRS